MSSCSNIALKGSVFFCCLLILCTVIVLFVIEHFKDNSCNSSNQKDDDTNMMAKTTTINECHTIMNNENFLDTYPVECRIFQNVTNHTDDYIMVNLSRSSQQLRGKVVFEQGVKLAQFLSVPYADKPKVC